MRIISGKYKGNLVSFHADNIRPTTDRVKESEFNILRERVEGARVLDLFAGTGSLGIESLSRGASELTMVESSGKSIDIIRKNLTKLKVQEAVKILQKDVLIFLRNYEGEPFDLVFADPPFTKSMADEVVLTYSQSKVFHATTILTIESGRKEKLEDDYPPLFRYDKREFGDKVLSFYAKKSETQ